MQSDSRRITARLWRGFLLGVVVYERPTHLKDYSDWEEACRYSREEKAVGQTVIDLRGKLVKAEIVKPRFGDATIHYYHSGLVIRKATAQEVDGVKKWRVY